ncbi:MAG: ABC-2 family transporter protein [Anaerolineae bacterium]|nr:ABC-2 family transporter protein [Anaerolineae bacterium]
MIRYLKLYVRLWALSVQAQMEYKVDFILGNVTTILGQVVGLAFVWVIFQNIGDLNGWTLPQIMLIYGIAALPFGLVELFFNGPWRLNYLVRMGEFDRLLVRPGGPLFFLLSSEAALHGLGDFFTGLVIIAVAANNLHLSWTVANIGFLTLAVACGTLIYVSIYLGAATTAFWFIGASTSIMYLAHSLRNFSTYPLTIYARPIQILLTWIAPFAFTSFFPATFLLGVKTYYPFVLFIPVIAVVCFGLAYGSWRIGLNQYQSTGS